MAVAHPGLDNGNLGMLNTVLDKAGAAAGDEHIHQAAQTQQLIGFATVG